VLRVDLSEERSYESVRRERERGEGMELPGEGRTLLTHTNIAWRCVTGGDVGGGALSEGEKKYFF
jgi:hypothetical protein